ncbi:MAG TPA: hypothetical protein VN905_09620 [Candidatus Binatia bacterium]|nr:hypothetical protein [Candidatus Binatia bacterium]
MHPLFAAFILGIVAGMRAFTAPAAVYLMRGGVAGIVLAVFAVVEYVTDLLPTTPARTSPPSLIARIVSGAFVGYLVGGIGGIVLGLAGVFIGAYGGKAARLWAIEKIGPIAAGLAESAIAILLAAFVVTR